MLEWEWKSGLLVSFEADGRVLTAETIVIMQETGS